MSPATTCSRCGRPYTDGFVRHDTLACMRIANQRIRDKAAAVYYVHTVYGCGTGCCGHTAMVVDADDHVLRESRFDFMHDRDAIEHAARALAHQYDAPFVSERCEFVDD